MTKNNELSSRGFLRDLTRIVDSSTDSGQNLSDIRKLVHKIRHYRPYRTPKNYIKWDCLSALLATSVYNLNFPYLFGDEAAFLSSHRCGLWLVQDAPLYAISPGLLQEFQAVSIEGSLTLDTFNPPLQSLLVLFPQGMLRTPTGSHLDWLIIHVSHPDRPERSCGDDPDLGFKLHFLDCDSRERLNFHYTGVSDDGCTWFSGSAIDLDGEFLFSDRSLGADELTSADRQFTKTLRNIGLQCLMVLCFAPELVEVDQVQQNVKRSKYGHQKVEPRSVRWLGKGYQRTSKKLSGSVGKRNSPRGHWRRGHWHYVPCGKGRRDRKLQLFSETWVG